MTADFAALPEYITLGEEDEAVAYVAEFGAYWSGVPGALEWVASRV